MKRSKNYGIIGAMRSSNVVILITVALMLVGIIALIKMPRNEFPNFTIRQGVIVGVYPGATSPEIEKQLTRVVENYIFGYKEIKKAKTYSHSSDGMMYIFVELNDNVKNADEFWSKLRHGLNELKMTLPSGVIALVANTDFGDTSALLITLSSNTLSYKELEVQLKKLENECRKLPAASKIKHFGLQKEKIFVNVKPELLNEYNIKSLSLLGSYQANGMVSYGGKLDDGQTVMPVHFPPNYESEKDLKEQIVYSDPNGNVVRLKNIATIDRRYDEPDSYIRQNGKKTILLSLEMEPGNNIVQFGKEVDKVIADFKKQSPKELEVAKISELPKYVKDSVNDFLREFLIAVVAVILVTMVLLPFRVASVAGITVPISVLVTLAVLYRLGIDLNTVSLASLILVLGMIVDNSIVVIDNHVEKIDNSISPWHASILSAKELVAPIIVATLAIMVAYIPLGFMVPGTAGEFIQGIPIVVSTALIVSVLVALFLVPYFDYIFIKKGLRIKSAGDRLSFLYRLQTKFKKSLEAAFHHPKLIIGTGIITIIIALVIFSSIPRQLFPEMERNQFAVEIYLPTGSSLKSTGKIVDSLESMLLKDHRVTNVTSFIGTSSPRFHTVYAPQMPASNYGQLLVNTTSDKATRGVVNEYSPKYSDSFENAHVKWKILALQPSTAPIEIRISSDSVKDIRATEEKIMEILKDTRSVGWIRNDWKEPQQNVMVNMDKDRANRLSYYKGLVATSLMIGLDGVPLTTIWEDDFPVDVLLTQETSPVKDLTTVKNQFITSPVTFSGAPLRSFATFVPEWTEGVIVHRNGVPTLTISVDNKTEVVASAILDDLQPKIEKLTLPEGTNITYGGDYQAQQEVFVPMGIALVVSIIIIFFVLLIQFRKAKISLLIMSTMLLTLPGAAIGLKIMNYPFSITAFIGITSLCGMVIRNGIILIDYANELKQNHKMHVREAAIAAGKRRMRPIFLTSAAAGVGVIPMILSRSPLWGPLGTVICFGLFISMVLTLYILPILFSYSFRDKVKKPGFWSLPGGIKVMIPGLFLLLPLHQQHLIAQSVTLDSCKQLALKNNVKLRIAGLQLQEAKLQRKEARTLYFPKVDASIVGMWSSDYLIKGEIPSMNLPVWDGHNPAQLQHPSLFAYVPSIPIEMLDYFKTAAVSVAVPVFTGGRIYNGNRLAKVGEEVSAYQKGLTTNQILLQTEELYWTLQSLLEKKKTLLSYQMLLDSLSRDVSSFSSAGLIQQNDLLKIKLKQQELKSSDLKLTNGIEMSTRALCQQVGISYESTLVFEKPGFEDSTFIAEVDPAKTVENRYEYQLLNKSVIAREIQKKMVIGEYMPQLSVVGTGFSYDMMNTSTNNSLALVSLNVPISDWWGGSHKIRQQQLEIEKARNELIDNKELMTLEIRSAHNDVLESIMQIKVADQSVNLAKENLKICTSNYNAGITAISDLLEAQALYQKALDEANEARCQFQIKKARYLNATGNNSWPER